MKCAKWKLQFRLKCAEGLGIRVVRSMYPHCSYDVEFTFGGPTMSTKLMMSHGIYNGPHGSRGV